MHLSHVPGPEQVYSDPCPMPRVLQEQYKCVYDTLEEYVICGTSFFYVHQLSERLKQKSLKERTASSKKLQNEYEREYCVSISYS